MRSRKREAFSEGWSVWRKLLAAGLVLAAALVLYACGSSSGSSSESVEDTAEVASEGGASGDIADKYKNLKIGVAHFTSADEGEAALVAALKEAVDRAGLNWELIEADAKADPNQAGDIITSFVNQGVDAIIDLVIPSRAIQPALEQAKEAGIPVFGLWTFSETDPLMSIDYTPLPAADEAALAGFMANQLYDKYPEGSIEIALLDTDLDILQARPEVLKAILKLYPRIEIVDEANVDLADAVGSATQIANAFMTAHPNLKAIWTNYPPSGVPAAAAVQARNKEDEIGVYMHIGGKAGLEALRDETSPVQAMPLVDLDYQSYKTIEFMLAKIAGEELNRLVSYEDVVPVFNVTKKTAADVSGEGVAFEEGWTRENGAWKAPMVQRWKERFSE